MANYTLETIGILIAKTTLSEREKTVLCLRLEGKTLKEIGKIIKPVWQPKDKDDGGLEQERIRQIEAKACRKLKHPTRWGGKHE